MSYWLSEPGENLLQHPFCDDKQQQCEDLPIQHIIVGSGYGACMTALVVALAETGAIATRGLGDQRRSSNAPEKIKVAMLERGLEYLPGEFPKGPSDTPGIVSIVRQGCRIGADQSLWDLRIGDGVSTLSGNGLGGTSLVNANVALQPESALLENWPRPAGADGFDETASWSQILSEFYDLAEELLAVAPHPSPNALAKYRALGRLASRLHPDQANKVKPAPLMVNFGDNPSMVKDQPSCIDCGNCVTGCNTGAKNSLNLSILPLLKHLGVRVFTGVEVMSLEKNSICRESAEPVPRWRLHARLTAKQRSAFTLAADNVVLSAGTLGSTEILKRSVDQHGLDCSSTLGSRLSTNGDSIAFGFGQKEPVNSVAIDGNYDSESREKLGIGPTIVGYVNVNLPVASGPQSASQGGATAQQIVSDQGAYRGTIQDGTIPFPVRWIWSELLCTQALLKSYVNSKPSAWHRQNKDHDRLLPSESLDDHSQTLMVMGADNASGSLRLDEGGEYVVPVWNAHSDRHPFIESIDRTLSHIDVGRPDSSGFNGGSYLQNPLWRPLPSGFSEALEGAADCASHVVSVHPLGGCAMGLDGTTGVVNLKGQVYDTAELTRFRTLQSDYQANPHCLHEGLYVADGSIVPASLGINPALTIAALGLYVGFHIGADRFEDVAALRADVSDLRHQARNRFSLKTVEKHPQVKTTAESKDAALDAELNNEQESRAQDVVGGFEEYLFTRINNPDHPRNQPPDRFDTWEFLDKLGLCDEVRQGIEAQNLRATQEHPLEHESDSDDDGEAAQNNVAGTHADRGNEAYLALRIIVPELNVSRFLRKPDSPMPARAELYLLPHSVVHRIQKECMAGLKPLLVFETGHIKFGTLERPRHWGQKQRRVFKALRRFLYYRRREIHFKPAQFLNVFKLIYPPVLMHKLMAIPALSGRIRGYYRVAAMHTDWRSIDYNFSTEANTGDFSLELNAKKEFAYALPKQDLWNALGWMQLKAIRIDLKNRANKKNFKEAFFKVDVVSISRGPSPLQIIQTPDLPATWARIIAGGLYYFRVIMQTHLWSLGAASYDTFKSRQELVEWRTEDPPEQIVYRVPGRKRSMWARRSDPAYEPRDQRARLIKYTPDRTHRHESYEPVLLVHGLAHSSRVFWTDTMGGRQNFVQSMLAKGYEVWIVDHRTSASLIAKVNERDTWDDIARIDIPWAVNYVFDRANAGLQTAHNPQKVHVFAHCIGAGAVSMAVLSGLLHRNNICMLASYAMHAVPPWLYASPENRIRANFYSLVKDWPIFTQLDPVPSRDSNFLEILLDRFASIYQWNARDWRRVSDKDRGSEFARKVFSRYRFIWGHQWTHDNVDAKTKAEFAKMIGPVPVAVVKQVYFSIFRNRLTDDQGTNKYVKSENFRNYWQFPTLFLHGDKNDVFDVESSKLSAELLTRLQLNHLSGSQSHLARMTSSVSEEFRLRKCCNSIAHVGHRVWIKILPGYGHMDVLFGKNSANDVHNYVAHFFSKANLNLGDSRCRREDEYPRNMRRHASEKMHEEEIRYKRPLLVGPVISHVDGDTVRVWAESNDFVSQGPVRFSVLDSNRQEISVNRDSQDSQQGQHSDARDRSNFWLTEVPIAKTRLEPGQFPLNAIVRFRHETESPASTELQSLHESVPEMNWTQLGWYRRQLSTKSKNGEKLSLLLGSCLHPGTTFERRKSDLVFRGISIQAGILEGDDGEIVEDGADALIMLGDTIYADATASVFDPHSFYERFRVRYRSVFGGEYARHLFANLPTHFVIDDHEIIDNWQGLPDPKESDSRGPDEHQLRYQFETAVNEAWYFQRRPASGWKMPADRESPELWDEFSVAGFPFFSLDTRTERCGETSRSERRALIGDRQAKIFADWLADQATAGNEVIFIASGAPLAPVVRDVVEHPSLAAWSDDLNAYPGFLLELTKLLLRYQDTVFRNVGHLPTIFWLSGDLHFSFDADVRLKIKATNQNLSVDVRHICASGLHAPIPFTNEDPNNYDWGNAPTSASSVVADRTSQQSIADEDLHWVDLGLMKVGFRGRFLTAHPQHFVRLDCDATNRSRPSIMLQAYDENGRQLNKLDDQSCAQINCTRVSN